mgnify:FL=1
MFRKLSILMAVLVAGAGSLFAQMPPFDPSAPMPEDPDVRKGVLDNGMTYYIRHNAKPEKQAEFYIFHNVGAMPE